MTYASDHPIGIPAGWTFVSNHGHVLRCTARDPDTRRRGIAERIGISQRAVSPVMDTAEHALCVPNLVMLSAAARFHGDRRSVADG